jgi:hypothetical protein
MARSTEIVRASGTCVNDAANHTSVTETVTSGESSPTEVWSPPSGKLLLWKSEVARWLGVHENTIDRLSRAGRFPAPDQYLGRRPVCRPERISKWAKGGGR